MNRQGIPYGRQNITEDDISEVVKSLASDYLTQGPKIAEFEKAFSEYVGSNFSVAVSNGTAALHLSVLALGLQPGDKVITTSITFAASANCIRYCGAEPVFADIDPDTYLIDFNSVKRILASEARGAFKGLVLVDFAGRAIDLEAFRELADEYRLWIIEDSCHAPGGYFIDSQSGKQNCGNGNFADLAIFSFHPVKHIATGEGGMITTNSRTLYDKLVQLRTHGITRDPKHFLNDIAFAVGVENSNSESYPGWYMEMQSLGYNYRLTDFQAALGISQLGKAQVGLIKRREIAARYYDAFKEKPFVIGQTGILEGHAYHLYIIEVKDRLGLYNHLREKDIFAQVHYIPCHLMPYYKELGWKQGDLPNAENYYRGCLSLPMYPTLTGAEQNYVIKAVEDFYIS